MDRASDFPFDPAAAACRRAARSIAAAALLALAANAPAQTEPAASPPASASRASVTLDFANAEIDAVARTMATLTGRNVVVDPRVKGTMTLTSTTPVSQTEALRLFATQLRTQGFALIESHGISVVVPEAEAKLQSEAVSAGPARTGGGGQIMTQIFRLTHENASSLVPILRPLISPNNTININPGTNAVVITDYADNLQRLGRIIAALDVANATGLEIVRLRYAVASDLAPLVAKLLEPGGSASSAPQPVQPAPGQGGAVTALTVGSSDGYRTTIVPEPRSNALILRAANPARLALARTLIEQLDQPPAAGRADGASGNIHVVYLKNADAVKLAATLRAALAALPGQSGNQAGGGGPAANSGGLSANRSSGTATASNSSDNGLASGPSIDAAGNNQPSTGGPIQADPSTNSLIISAPEPIYRELRAVIDQLDQRRAQVFIESLIAEVRVDKLADIGVQWQALAGNGSSTIGVIGTNYQSAGNGSAPNIFDFASQFIGMTSSKADGISITGQPVMPSAGFNLIAGTRTLGILANFLQSTGSGNVLSTPTLLTLDNEEARIIVGQNVPFVTGSYTNTGASTTAVSPFQTYDRKDVGLTLRVRPQISEDGTIKLVIYQETSSVVDGTATNSSGPITNKRAIESSVLVNDGAIVVLGGLLEDNLTDSESKVPVLGDVPLVGNLFKSRNRHYVKTNLMVFLRPAIVRDAAAAESYSLSRYDFMRAAQQSTQPKPSAVLQINEGPVLPPVTPVRPDAWTRPAPPPPMIQPAAGDRNIFD